VDHPQRGAARLGNFVPRCGLRDHHRPGYRNRGKRESCFYQYGSTIILAIMELETSRKVIKSNEETWQKGLATASVLIRKSKHIRVEKQANLVNYVTTMNILRR
jgi:hypothetical protein